MEDEEGMPPRRALTSAGGQSGGSVFPSPLGTASVGTGESGRPSPQRFRFGGAAQLRPDSAQSRITAVTDPSVDGDGDVGELPRGGAGSPNGPASSQPLDHRGAHEDAEGVQRTGVQRTGVQRTRLVSLDSEGHDTVLDLTPREGEGEGFAGQVIPRASTPLPPPPPKRTR